MAATGFYGFYCGQFQRTRNSWAEAWGCMCSEGFTVASRTPTFEWDIHLLRLSYCGTNRQAINSMLQRAGRGQRGHGLGQRHDVLGEISSRACSSLAGANHSTITRPR